MSKASRKAVADAPTERWHGGELMGFPHRPVSLSEINELLAAARDLLKQTRVDNSLLKRLKDAVEKIDGSTRST